MRIIVAIMLVVGLAACSSPRTETFSCPNGPEIGVTYADDTATITFADGATEVVPQDPSQEGVYVKPGFAWTDTGFRTGRLFDGTSSYACDQSSI